MPDELLSPQHLTLAVFGIALAYGPVVALILARKVLGALNTAAWLVTWGALIPGFEHTNFAISGSRALARVPAVSLHLRYHFFMAGIFTAIAAGLLVLIAFTLLRSGRREGWFAVLVALLFGGFFEVTGAAGTLFHGFPPSWPVGLVIYAYLVAWGSALVIAYRPVFDRVALFEKDRRQG